MRKIIRKILCPLLLLIGVNAHSQINSYSGVVIGDDDNLPLPNVTVTVKGTRVSTKTNSVGFYSIAAQKGQQLVFTFVDYSKKEITIGNEDKINVRLVQSQKQLEDVVVTAYGASQNKRGLAYNAQSIKGTAIAETQRDNWINALAGRVAGANITPTSGTPGASTSIVLRGAVSLGQSNQPLFVVDGVPIDNQTMNQENLIPGGGVSFGNRNSDYGNRASDINPEDIESVTILKGPEASALYGSDGASGAIVITTKRGRSGKASVSYDNSFRMEQVYLFPQTQKIYGRGINGIADPNATVNPFGAGAQYAYFGPKYAEGTKLYDNVDAFFKKGFTQRHNLNVDGGSDVSTFRLSLSYLDQDGVVPNTAFERLTAKLGGTAKFSDKLNISSSFTYVNSTTDKASKGAGGYLLNLLNYPQDLDVRDYINPDGTRKLYRSSSTALSAEFDNPFWDVNKNPAQDKLDRITLNFTANFNPFKWLNFTGIIGSDLYSQTGYYVMHPQSRFGLTSNGFINLYEQNTRNLNTVLRSTAKKTFGKFSNTFTAGIALDDNKTKIESQKGERFYESNFISVNNTDPISRDARTTILNDRKVRFFSNYVLGYDNIAYLSLAGTREGTSKLNSRVTNQNPYYNFGAASFSFIFSDLPTLKNINWLNLAKGRVSYGTTGKGPALPYIVDNTFVSQGTTGGGYAYGVTGNNFNLNPEYTNTLEFGGEIKLFKNRVSLDVTRYSLTSKDQIIPARTSYGTGFIIKYLNGGVITNKGIEAVLTVNAFKNEKFRWDITANFDRNRGSVKELPKGLPTYYDSDTWVYGNLRSQAYVGASVGNLGGISVAKNTAGQVLINPASGLPFINPDFIPVGDRQSKYRVGLINNFTYKNLSLSFNLDFRQGGDVFNGNEYFLFLTGLSTKSVDREKPVIVSGVLADGLQNTNNPTTSTITVYPYFRSTDYYAATTATEGDFIESVNWMRLRDATITYRLPQRLLSRQKVFKSASVFVTGTDLFIITNYTGADPSVNVNNASNRGVGGAGLDYGSLSTPRGLNAGLKVQF